MQSGYGRQWVYSIPGALLAVSVVPSLARACAVCWGAEDALTQALSTSVLFLMAMPFVVGGSIMGVLFMAQKRARGQRWPSGAGKPLS
jgi:hypothetical protein